MPDNWGFVAAAYGLTAAVLLLYWRRLVRKEKELTAIGKRTRHGHNQPPSDSAPSVAERSHQPSRAAHPRLDPDTKSSLPTNPTSRAPQS